MGGLVSVGFYIKNGLKDQTVSQSHHHHHQHKHLIIVIYYYYFIIIK